MLLCLHQLREDLLNLTNAIDNTINLIGHPNTLVFLDLSLSMEDRPCFGCPLSGVVQRRPKISMNQTWIGDFLVEATKLGCASHITCNYASRYVLRWQILSSNMT